MTALEALALADAANVRVSIARDHIRWRCRGDPPADVLAALKVAKPEIVKLLTLFGLDSSGALTGDALLERLAGLGFRVRRYGHQAALDDDTGQGRLPPAPLLYDFADRQQRYGAVLAAHGAADRETSP
jgi:hypothetical protein